MKKTLFIKYQQRIVSAFVEKIESIENITYNDFLMAYEQEKINGHDDPFTTALFTIFLDFSISHDDIKNIIK